MPKLINFYHEKDPYLNILKYLKIFLPYFRFPTFKNMSDSYSYDENKSIYVMKNNTENDKILKKGISNIVYHISFRIASILLSEKCLEVIHSDLTYKIQNNDDKFLLFKLFDNTVLNDNIIVNASNILNKDDILGLFCKPDNKKQYIIITFGKENNLKTIRNEDFYVLDNLTGISPEIIKKLQNDQAYFYGKWYKLYKYNKKYIENIANKDYLNYSIPSMAYLELKRRNE